MLNDDFDYDDKMKRKNNNTNDNDDGGVDQYIYFFNQINCSLHRFFFTKHHQLIN